jgi:hypothetical protein
MNRLALALLVCAACKHSTSSSSTSHSETSAVTDTQTSESGATTTTTTVTEQPGETTTTTEEFAPLENTTAPEGAVGQSSGAAQPPATTEGRIVPRHGPLVKRTVTVTKSGGETTQTRQEARDEVQRTVEVREQAEADAKAKAAEQGGPSAGCVGASWIWGLGILAFAVAAILRILKFRKP